MTDEDAQDCPKHPGDSHCDHWWDGDPCCSCGAPAMTEARKLEQGMDP